MRQALTGASRVTLVERRAAVAAMAAGPETVAEVAGVTVTSTAMAMAAAGAGGATPVLGSDTAAGRGPSAMGVALAAALVGREPRRAEPRRLADARGQDEGEHPFAPDAAMVFGGRQEALKCRPTP